MNKSPIFFTSLLLLAGALGACSTKPPAESPGAPCALGAQKAAADGCNTCTCTRDGWACTELGCVDGPTSAPGSKPSAQKAPTPPSTQGSEPSSQPTKKSPAPPKDGPATECKPGDTMDTVPQDADHQVICDMMPPTTPCPNGTVNGSDGSCYACIPEVADQQAFNHCTCSDGGKWECERSKMECAEGAQKKAADGCNLCRCGGGEWQCTEKACVN